MEVAATPRLLLNVLLNVLQRVLERLVLQRVVLMTSGV